METRDRAEVFPRTIRKVIVTLLVGGSSFAVTNVIVDDANLVWSITLSVFVGGVVFVVQFLVDADTLLQAVRDEQHRHNDEMRRLVGQGFLRISEATELFGLVEASAMETEVVTRFMRNAATLGRDTPRLVRLLALSEIERVSCFLRKLGEGTAVHEGEDREWLLALARHTQTSIDAISTPGVDAGAWDLDRGFWTSDLGVRYLQIQRDRVREGVRIRRIFVVNTAEHADGEMSRRIFKWQSEISIDVRVLHPTEIQPTMRGWLSDFIVFDGLVSYETIPGPDVGEGMHMIMNTQLVLDPARVKSLTERFNVLWELARPPS